MNEAAYQDRVACPHEYASWLARRYTKIELAAKVIDLLVQYDFTVSTALENALEFMGRDALAKTVVDNFVEFANDDEAWRDVCKEWAKGVVL